MVEFLRFLYLATQAYRRAESSGHCVYTRHWLYGVTQCAVIVAVNRNAAVLDSKLEEMDLFDPTTREKLRWPLTNPNL